MSTAPQQSAILYKFILFNSDFPHFIKITIFISIELWLHFYHLGQSCAHGRDSVCVCVCGVNKGMCIGAQYSTVLCNHIINCIMYLAGILWGAPAVVVGCWVRDFAFVCFCLGYATARGIAFWWSDFYKHRFFFRKFTASPIMINHKSAMTPSFI